MCRILLDDDRNKGRIIISGRSWRAPVHWLTGLWRLREETTAWALAWDMGACRDYVKEACQVGSTRKSSSTNAFHTGGSLRSSEETSVMEVDQRG